MKRFHFFFFCSAKCQTVNWVFINLPEDSSSRSFVFFPLHVVPRDKTFVAILEKKALNQRRDFPIFASLYFAFCIISCAYSPSKRPDKFSAVRHKAKRKEISLVQYNLPSSCVFFIISSQSKQ